MKACLRAYNVLSIAADIDHVNMAHAFGSHGAGLSKTDKSTFADGLNEGRVRTMVGEILKSPNYFFAKGNSISLFGVFNRPIGVTSSSMPCYMVKIVIRNGKIHTCYPALNFN